MKLTTEKYFESPREKREMFAGRLHSALSHIQTIVFTVTFKPLNSNCWSRSEDVTHCSRATDL